MRAAARTLPTPKSRSMSRRVRSCRSRFSSWLMASGMARSHRGFAGIVKSSRAGDQAGRRRRERPRPGCRGEDLHAGPSGRGRRPVRRRGPVTAAPVPGRLEASASPPAAGPGAASSAATTLAARPRRPRGAASSSTSAGGPPDPPGAAAAEAGVSGAKNLRSAGLDVLGDPAAFLSRADPGRSPAGPGPVWVNPLTVLKLGRFPGDMYLDMLVNVRSKSKIRVGAVRLSHKAGYGMACQARTLPQPRPNAAGVPTTFVRKYTPRAQRKPPGWLLERVRAPSVGFRPLPQTTRRRPRHRAAAGCRGGFGRGLRRTDGCRPPSSTVELPQGGRD